MAKELKDLDDVLTDLCNDASRKGVPLWTTPIELNLWIDTHLKFCTPVIGKLLLDFQATAFRRDRVFSILRMIDSVTPIAMMTIKGKEYHITKTEVFMNKPCEAY
jgi:hypothetical protein